METKITIIYKGIKKEVEYPKTELQLKEIFDLINDNKFSESSNLITYLNNEQEEKIHNESLFNELNENSNEKVELILKKEVNPTKKSLLSNLINKLFFIIFFYIKVIYCSILILAFFFYN